MLMVLYVAAHAAPFERDARAWADPTSVDALPQLIFQHTDSIENPPPGNTIRNQRWALVQIPLQTGEGPAGFKLTAISVKPEISFADGSTWTSDWQSLLAFGRQLGLGTPTREGDLVAAFLIERPLFDAKAAIPATLHLTLAVVRTQETDVSALQLADEFLLPGWGVCRSREPAADQAGGPAWCLLPEPVPVGMVLNGSSENCGSRWPDWYGEHGMGTQCLMTMPLALGEAPSTRELRVSYQLVKECRMRGGNESQANCTAARIVDRDSDEIDISGIHLGDYQF
jgi:hypothetical protein